MNKANSFNKKKVFLALVALTIIFSLVLTLYLSTKNEIKRKEIDERINISVLILNDFGYGGIIHNFKNYLLRGESQNYTEVLNKYSQIKKLVNRYSEKEISGEEKRALKEVFQAASKYREQVEIVKFERNQKGFSIASIDKLVKIDDSIALKSISLLINSLNHNKELSEESSKKLNLIFLLFLFVLIILLCVLYFKEIVYLEQINNKLLIANEELGQFSYRTSHDLKAPLVTVKCIARAIVEDVIDEDYEEVKINASKIEIHVVRLENLVIDILNLAKADLEIQSSEYVKVKDVVLEIQEKLEGIYTDNNVKIETDFNHSHDLFISKIRFTQVLENLISNAIKYSDKEKEECYVKITTSTEDKIFLVQVEDNGLGIPLEYQNRVFKMFERFHQNVSTGSGLGMYIVKKHLDKMEAKVGFTSSSEGTKFEIKFKIIRG